MNLRIPVPYQILESVKAVALELCRVQTDSARQEIPHVLRTAPSHLRPLCGHPLRAYSILGWSEILAVSLLLVGFSYSER